MEWIALALDIGYWILEDIGFDFLDVNVGKREGGQVTPQSTQKIKKFNKPHSLVNNFIINRLRYNHYPTQRFSQGGTLVEYVLMRRF